LDNGDHVPGRGKLKKKKDPLISQRTDLVEAHALDKFRPGAYARWAMSPP